MESAHHFFIQTWLQQYSRGPFSQQYHFVSERWGVDVQWFQERSSQALPNSRELSAQMTLSFHVSSKNFCKHFSVSWEVLVLHGWDWIPLSCQILYHDSTLMIVSRITSFTENFVICCYQVINIFCSRYGSASAFSARSPRYFGPHAELAIFVLREMSINTALARYHSCSQLWSWFTRRSRGCVPMNWNTFIHKILRKFF